MMKELFFLQFIFLIFLSTGCSPQNSSPQIKHQSTRKPLEQRPRDFILTVLKLNESLHKFYFNYNPQNIEIVAQKMYKTLSENEQIENFKALKQDKEFLKKIKADADREENNLNYYKFLISLISIVKEYDVGSGHDIYSCPMVKMSWIQNSQSIPKVNNPYAPNMPFCGSKDTEY